MRGVQKLLLAIALALLMAIAFVACGSDDSSSDSSPTAPRETTATTPSDGSSSSGEGSASFHTPGGDNSIQNFGAEADGDEVEAATVALSGFMQARAEGDWEGQCTYLAEAAIKPLEDLASNSPQLEGKGCAAILAALGERVPVSTRANSLTDGIASLRAEGDRGFALYHGAKGVDYFVPMTEEDGEWKVGALAPTEFP